MRVKPERPTENNASKEDRAADVIQYRAGSC